MNFSLGFALTLQCRSQSGPMVCIVSATKSAYRRFFIDQRKKCRLEGTPGDLPASPPAWSRASFRVWTVLCSHGNHWDALGGLQGRDHECLRGTQGQTKYCIEFSGQWGDRLMGRELGLGIGLCSYFMYKSFKVNAHGSTKALSIQVLSRADIGTPVYGCIFMSLPCTWKGDVKAEHLQMRADTLSRDSCKQHCWEVSCLWNLTFPLGSGLLVRLSLLISYRLCEGMETGTFHSVGYGTCPGSRRHEL